MRGGGACRFGILVPDYYFCGGMRRIVIAITLWTSCLMAVFGGEPIAGKARVDAAAMTQYVQQHNPDFDPQIATAFFDVGERYGIRGDVALCQAVLETGWFRFGGGTAVTPDQHNYCGMGVVSGGLKGASFDTVEQGVEAMVQHLYAYCCKEALPEEATVYDPRFALVTRGCAPEWEALSMRWAMNPNYGRDILRIYNGLLKSQGLDVKTFEEKLEEKLEECESDEVSLQDLF